MKNLMPVIWGLIAFTPISYIVVSWILIIPSALQPMNDFTSIERGMSQAALNLIINMIFIIAILIIICAFVLNVRNNKSIHDKFIWILLIIIGSIITIPIYWYKYILKSKGI